MGEEVGAFESYWLAGRESTTRERGSVRVEHLMPTWKILTMSTNLMKSSMSGTSVETG